METIKNYSNHSFQPNIPYYYFCDADISVFITFEILVVLISLLIVSASSLVIYQITKVQVKKVKYDVAFISLSVSDIGVGLFSVPLLGINKYYHRNCRNFPLIGRFSIIFFNYFPYSFSCLFTAFIAVDRMFAITMTQKYKNLVTQKIFKVIAIILFLISVTISSILTTPVRYVTIWAYIYTQIVIIILIILCPIVVVLAHLYILHFAARRKDLKKLRKHHGKNSNGKRLTRTIIYICISQLICVFPFILFQFILLCGCIPFKLYGDILQWLALLLYCQCFCDAFVILHNKKSRWISKK